MIPGEIISQFNKTITLNYDKPVTVIKVANLGDRPVQVGSHFHFFEVNKQLAFDRENAFAKRLNIPSGTAVRFEPGEIKTIELIEFGGQKNIIGFNNLVDGKADYNQIEQIIQNAHAKGFHCQEIKNDL